MGKISKEEINRLLNMGFSLDLIAAEFNMQIELPNKDQSGHEKLQIMRRKYNELFFRDNSINLKTPSKPIKTNIFSDNKPIKTSLSEEDNEFIKRKTEKIKEKIEELKLEKNQEGKHKIVSSITKTVRELLSYPLTLEQTEEISNYINSDEFENVSNSPYTKLFSFLTNVRREIANKLVNCIFARLEQANDLEEISVLEKKLTDKTRKNNPIAAERIRTVLSSKRQKLREKQVAEEIRYGISPDIEKCIIDLTKGNLDVKKAKKIINDEAKKRVESKKQNNPFCLTEEQEERQIIHQIRIVISDRGEKYPIQNAEEALKQLQELCGGQPEISIRAVVKNLLAAKDYGTAKNICRKCFSNGATENVKQCINMLEREITLNEISEYVLAGIKNPGTPEQESSYFELIERGVRQSGIKLKHILLGKSKDGLREITLEDVWPDAQNKPKEVPTKKWKGRVR